MSSVHEFYNQHGFIWVASPVITFSDCEGAGEAFKVTTDYKEEFFQKPAYLTVSGQLECEAYATAMTRVYTFGPTFRAEKSSTSRHLSEFWMIEPEVAFITKDELMTLAEQFVQQCIRKTTDLCEEDLEYLIHYFTGQPCEVYLDQLEKWSTQPFVRLSYTEAIEKLQKSGEEFPENPVWGIDLCSEHEQYLTDTVYKCPVILYDYPQDIKAFYMKPSTDSSFGARTVEAFDVLVPGIGELIGGSIREDSYDTLVKRMTEVGLQVEDYQEYLDLRRYGTVPHGGFGLGFERLIRLVTCVPSVKDTIPFPRYYQSK